jgi:hypothetical protein
MGASRSPMACQMGCQLIQQGTWVVFGVLATCYLLSASATRLLLHLHGTWKLYRLAPHAPHETHAVLPLFAPGSWLGEDSISIAATA